MIEKLIEMVKKHKQEVYVHGLKSADEINSIRSSLSQKEADVNALRGSMQTCDYLIEQLEEKNLLNNDDGSIEN